MDAEKLWKVYWYPTYFFLSSLIILFIAYYLKMPLAKYILIAFVIIAISYSFIFYFIWAFSLGHELYKRTKLLIANNQFSYIIYILSVILLILSGIGFILYLRFFHVYGMKGFLFFILIAMGLRLYIGTFLAKRILSIENRRNIEFNDYKSFTFSFMYFPHNIKRMHPRIQNLLLS